MIVREVIERLLYLPLEEEITLRCSFPIDRRVEVGLYASTADGRDRGHVELGTLELPEGSTSPGDPLAVRSAMAEELAAWLESGHGAGVAGNGILAERVRQKFAR